MNLAKLSGNAIYEVGVDTRQLFRVEATADKHYFAIRDSEPRFAFIGSTIAEVATLAERALALVPGRRIISRAEWDALIAEARRLEDQIARYGLPTQRGARSRAKKRLAELNAEICAVDGVIGIDA